MTALRAWEITRLTHVARHRYGEGEPREDDLVTTFEADILQQRERMVRTKIEARGIRDSAVLAAMRSKISTRAN